MLFHVTAKHEVAFCGAYDKSLQAKVAEDWASLHRTSEELGVKVKSWGIDAPGHTVFMVLEAKSIARVSKLLLSNPMRQDYDVRPMMSHEDVMAMMGDLGPGEE